MRADRLLSLMLILQGRKRVRPWSSRSDSWIKVERWCLVAGTPAARASSAARASWGRGSWRRRS